MPVDTEAALAAETSGITGSAESGPESAESGQSPDFGGQVDALRQRIDALEGSGSEEEAQSLPDNTSFVDYLTSQVGADEGEEVDQSGVDYGQPAGDPDESDQIVAELDAYIAQAVQDRLAPVLSGLQRDQQEAQLRGLAEKYPDLRTPAMLDSIGSRLGPLADARQDSSLLADPKLVELAYLAAKAEATASAETPAQPGAGASVETGSASKPEPSESPEEAIQRAIVQGTGGDGARGVLY